MSINGNYNNFGSQKQSADEISPPNSPSTPQSRPASLELEGAHFIDPEELPQYELAANIEKLSLTSSMLNPNAEEFIPQAPSVPIPFQVQPFYPLPLTNPQCPYYLPHSNTEELLPYQNPRASEDSFTQKTDKKQLEETALVTYQTAQTIQLAPEMMHLPGEAIQFFSTQSRKSPLTVICQAIGLAKESIFLCVYTITSPTIIAAILERANAGVKVELQFQHINNHQPLVAHPNVKMKPFNSRYNALLHRKNLVIDNWLAILGSANFSERAFSHDVNFIAQIKNPTLCQLIRNWESGHCYTGSQRFDYYSLFFQNKQGLQNIIKTLKVAKKTIFVVMFILKNETILNTLHEASTRGVQVSVIVDSCEKRMPFYFLQALGSSVDLYESTHSGLLHCKICCVDRRFFILGSANWSNNGVNRNVEDVLIVHKPSPSQFAAFFDLWSELLAASELITASNVSRKRRKQQKPKNKDPDS